MQKTFRQIGLGYYPFSPTIPSFYCIQANLLSNHMINEKAVLWIILLSHSQYHNQVKGPLVIFFLELNLRNGTLF